MFISQILTSIVAVWCIDSSVDDQPISCAAVAATVGTATCLGSGRQQEDGCSNHSKGNAKLHGSKFYFFYDFVVSKVLWLLVMRGPHPNTFIYYTFSQSTKYICKETVATAYIYGTREQFLVTALAMLPLSAQPDQKGWRNFGAPLLLEDGTRESFYYLL